MIRGTVCKPSPPLGATRTSHSRFWDQQTGCPEPVRWLTFLVFWFFFSFLSTLAWEWVWFLFDFLTIKTLLLA